jgi:hypothetical protein
LYLFATSLGEVVACEYRLGSTIERSQDLKPNYQFEKRQRELEKKKKKAEKAQKKATPTDEPVTEAPPVAEAAVQPENKD